MTARRLGARSDKSGEIMLWGTAENRGFSGDGEALSIIIIGQGVKDAKSKNRI